MTSTVQWHLYSLSWLPLVESSDRCTKQLAIVDLTNIAVKEVLKLVFITQLFLKVVRFLGPPRTTVRCRVCKSSGFFKAGLRVWWLSTAEVKGFRGWFVASWSECWGCENTTINSLKRAQTPPRLLHCRSTSYLKKLCIFVSVRTLSNFNEFLSFGR